MRRPQRTEIVKAAFGRAVRALRVKQGLSQEALADLVGIHRTYIGDIERGVRNVGLENVTRIAAALSVSLSQLMKATERQLEKPVG